MLKKLHIIFIGLLFTFFLSEIVYSQVPGYENRKKFVVNETLVSGTTDLSNFPVLIEISDSELRSIGNGGSVQNINGYDIVFTSADGNSVLDHELSNYDPTTGSVSFWVRFPTLLSTENTPFFIYYGNSAINSDQSTPNTWDSTYELVLHFDENGITDATNNGNNGVNIGTQASTGKIGQARSFNAQNDNYIQIPDNSTLDITGDITISAWHRPNGFGGGPDLITKGDYNDSYGAWYDGNGELRFQSDNNSLNSNDNIQNNAWNFLNFTKSGSDGRTIYINSNSVGSDNRTNNFGTNNDPLFISTPQYPLNGEVDEVRISNIVRSAEWITTEYNNQDDPASFITEVNDAPLLSNIETSPILYDENSGIITVSSDITINGILNAQLDSFVLEISGDYFAGEEQLIFSDQNGISGSWNASNGRLTLTGTATIQTYQDAIRSVTYSNTNPSGPSPGVRNVTFTGFQSTESTNTVSREILVTGPINDPSLAFSNPVFHFDAKDINGNLNLSDQPSDNSTVQSWGDRSDNINGSGVDLSASNNNNNQRPIYNSSFFGGKNGLQYDGNDDNLTIPSNDLLNSGNYDQKSYAAVFRTGNSVNGLQIIYEQGNNSYGYQISIKDGIAYAYTYRYYFGFFPLDNSSINLGIVEPNQTYILIASQNSDNTWKANLNGGTIGIINGVGTRQDHTGDAIIGAENGTRDPQDFSSNPAGTNNFQGTIGELISWNSGLSNQDITTIYGYLCDKWCNDPPQLSNVEVNAVDYNDGGAAVAISSQIQVTDSDNNLIDGAEVSITNNFISTEDALSFTPTANVSGSYDPGTGVLTLSGQDTKANYESVLRSVTYQNSSPTPNENVRTVSFQVFDWDDASNVVSRDVNIITVNTPPVVFGISGTPLNYSEGTGEMLIANSAVITDDNSNLESAEIQISENYIQGEDLLVYNDQNGISGVWNSLTGILNLTGSTTVANYENALRSVRFLNTSSDPTEATRTISFSVNDGENVSNIDSIDVQVIAVNSPPVLSGLETENIFYESDPIFLTENITVSDPDDTDIEGATISITQNFDSSQDELNYSSIFGISGSFNSGSGTLTLSGTASFEDYQTAIRSITYSNSSPNATGPNREISFSVTDGNESSDVLTRNLVVNEIQALSGLQVWLKGDTGVITSGIEVVTWEDQSGNNNDYSGVAETGTRPTFLTNSAALNNQPSVTFAGNGDHFLDNDGEDYINGSDEFSMFVVMKSDVVDTDRGLFSPKVPNGADETLSLRYDEAGANNNGAYSNVIKGGILGNSTANQIETYSDVQTTSGQIISYQWQSGNSYDIFIDGILNNPSAAGPPPSGNITDASAAILGKGPKDDPNVNNQSWQGQIAEFIYFDRFLTAEERTTVENYLSRKYNVSIGQLTPADGGASISADDANNSYTTLSGPIFKEGFAGELSNGGTIELEVPEGFEWNTVASPSISVSPVYGGTTSLNISLTSVSSTTIIFTVNAASVNNPGEFEISGLEVRPTTGVLPNTGQIRNSGTTGLGGTTNYGLLITVPGDVSGLTYLQQPTTTSVSQPISPSVRIQLTDQFGNNTQIEDVTVTVGLNSGSGTLSGTLTNLSNVLGIVEFSDLSLDQVGSKELIAESSGLNDKISNTFNIVSPTSLAGFKIEKVSGGDISSKAAGQDFNVKVTAINGTGNTVSSFNGTVSITSNCTLEKGTGTTSTFSSGVLSSLVLNISDVGLCKVTATNTNGNETGNSNSFTVSAGIPNFNTSTLTSSPSVIINNGTSNSLITVQLKDEFGNNLTTGGQVVTINTTEGSISSVTDNNDGTYTATLTSSTNLVTATLSATLNGNQIADEIQVEFSAYSHIWVSQLGSIAEATNYYDPDNWNVNSVPGALSSVLIPADPTVGNEFPVVNQPNTEIGKLTIDKSGEFNISGGINFTVNGSVTGGGSITGSNNDTITLSGDLDIENLSIGTVVLNGNSDQDIVNPYLFQNLEISNPNTILIDEDLEINETLTMTSGELLIPSGINLLAENIAYNTGTLRFQRKISGVRGWRMLSSPVSSTYGDFLDGTLTQGYQGATYSTGSVPGDTLQPNVFWYLEDYSVNEDGLPATDNDRLRAPVSTSTQIGAGRGHWVFFFGDIPADPLYNDPLPDTLDVAGQEFGSGASEFDFNVTYTAEADSGWNLIGNPYGGAINWDNTSAWTKTNMESTIYVWDPVANNGNGEFLTWNGSVGSLGSGIIPSFQGFWVKANGPNPELKVTKSALTSGGNFLRKTQNTVSNNDYENFPPVIGLKAEGEGLSKTTFIMGGDSGSEGKDEQDALRLVPFSDTNIEFFTTLRDGTELTINNRPRNIENRQNIDLHFDAFENGQAKSGTYTISWPTFRNIPEEWIILLVDNETGQEIDLNEFDTYTFDHNSSAKMAKSSPSSGAPALRINNEEARFRLRITTSEIEADIPDQIFLSNNYPNPFNPSTTIAFGLSEESDVILDVFDMLGRKVQTLIDRRIPAGTYDVRFNASTLASGVYIYRLKTNNKVLSKKLTLIK